MASPVNDVTSKLEKDLKIGAGKNSGATSKSKEINILLLGETGVGKSTFINSLANYLHFKKFKTAQKNDLLVLIPTSFTVAKSVSEQVTVKLGSDGDKNEYQEVGQSATQGVKSYVFPMAENGNKLRLIDTPGMGDTKGVDQDDLNCDNILLYLSQLEELHAICFLMKPTNTRLTALFEYCVKQILTRLEKSAVHNLIFVFTNSRGTNYSPGDTLPCLRKMAEDIKTRPPHVEIPLTSDNIFSVDNEAFRLLAALKNGVGFGEDVIARNAESWKNSSGECWRMIAYILGGPTNKPLKPHQLKNTISINEARRMIQQLTQPLADISQLIEDNIYILEKHEKNLSMGNESLAEMKKKLYIPFLNLREAKMTQPATVCTNSGCAELYKVEDLNKWHYKTRCHDPCYLQQVPKEIIGDPNLQHCFAMGSSRNCNVCRCSYLKHMHIYYMTTVYDDKIEDRVMKTNVVTKEHALKNILELMGKVRQRKEVLGKEKDYIITTMAQYAHFLQHNAITPFNDSYKEYINHLIIRERGLGLDANNTVISNLENHLKRYEESKRAFDEALRLKLPASTITPQVIFASVQNLYGLEIFGKKLKELMKTQKTARKYEHDQSTEYIYPKNVEKPVKKAKAKSGGEKSDAEKGNTSGSGKSRNYRPHGNGQRDPPPPYPGNPPNNFNRQYNQYQDRPQPNWNPPQNNYNGPYNQHQNWPHQPNWNQHQPFGYNQTNQNANWQQPPNQNKSAKKNKAGVKTKEFTIKVNVNSDSDEQQEPQPPPEYNYPYNPQYPGYGPYPAYNQWGGPPPPMGPNMGGPPPPMGPNVGGPPPPMGSNVGGVGPYPYFPPGQHPQYNNRPNNNGQRGSWGNNPNTQRREYRTNFKQQNNTRGNNKQRGGGNNNRGGFNKGNAPQNKNMKKQEAESDSDSSSD